MQLEDLLLHVFDHRSCVFMVYSGEEVELQERNGVPPIGLNGINTCDWSVLVLVLLAMASSQIFTLSGHGSWPNRGCEIMSRWWKTWSILEKRIGEAVDETKWA